MGPAVCYGPGAISMKENWVQGALCAWSIVTRRRGMGYKIPPWGKGLKPRVYILDSREKEYKLAGVLD